MKIVHFVLGLATAIILGALINLGIKAFYPEPTPPTYPNYPAYPAPAAPCATKDVKCLETQTQQQTTYNAQQAAFQIQQQAYDDQMKIYNKNLFIIANVVGLVVFAAGFWLIFGGVPLVSNAVPVGMMLAGLWSIIYGYGRGWGSINDQLKFFVGLVIAVIVIGGSMWLMQRRAAAHK